MLDNVAKAPVEVIWNLLSTSFQAMLEAPGLLEKSLQSLISLLATLLLVPAVSWFIAFKATQVTISITAKAINIDASA